MKAGTRAVTYFSLPGGARSRSTRPRLDAATLVTQSFARRRRWVVVEPFVELGSRRGRPELARALERCREMEAVLLVPSLVAVGGDARFLDPLLHAGVRLASADRGPVGNATLRLLQDVAHHAQQEASDRSRTALDAARRRGVTLGSPRPEIGSRAGVAALRAQADAHAEGLTPVLVELLLSNPDASLRDLAALLDALDVPTPRSGRWGPSAVRNSLARAGLTAFREALRAKPDRKRPGRTGDG